ncbi:Hint domain-containing protein [Pseudoruegeria sp. SHC-113]|uniref:Hint domain-containing protein n=1 Tax=Pseudoruegeria sp. SHC-113 TaxID=2855439 RepID=UPI0021BB5322|nr:Hint domain-containing protein [Pseudoruegeria sp. SHC-113]MCT8158790.1 Hint domain-containing protein [Pseudoruegeria sp. SHC-113]
MADPFLSEIRYAGPASGDFAEVAVDPDSQKAGIQLVVYHPDGTMRGIYALGSPVAQVNGYDLHHIATTGISRDGAVALTSGGVVSSFLSFERHVTAVEGPAIGRSSRRIGVVNRTGETLVSGDGRAYRIHAGESSELVPSFLEGTVVNTPYGPRPVEELRSGDVVITDEGLRVLRWVGRRTISAAYAVAHNLQPIRIPAHSFGPNTPMHDLIVSPNQRLCLGSAHFPAFFDREEVMVPADQLAGWKGIRAARRLGQVSYVHLLFDTPCTVTANGLAAECFHPAARAAMHLCRTARRELLLRFPEMLSPTEAPSPAEAPSLQRHETRLALRLLDLPDAA